MNSIQSVLTDKGFESLVDKAIRRYKEYAPVGGYWVGFSAGKDSIVIAALAEEAKVEYELQHNLTCLDPHEAIQHMKKYYPECHINHPEKTFWELMKIKKFPPSRWVRWCCDELKEGGGEGRFVVTGVRWAESNKRKGQKAIQFDSRGSQSKAAIKNREIFQTSDDPAEKRRMLETCITTGKHILNPIIEWSDSDVWALIKSWGLKYPSLYDEGFTRIGCIGCPLASTNKRKAEIDRYPQFRRAYVRSFNYIVDEGHKCNKYLQYENGEDAFCDWLNRGQISEQKRINI
jgi:phosphoadenosine phosphosulfate reductase